MCSYPLDANKTKALSLRNQLPHAEYFSQYDCAGGATCNKSRKQPREFRTELRKIGWSKTPRWLWPPPGSEGVPGNIFCVSLSEWKFMLFPGNRTHLKPGKSVWSFLSVFVTKEHRCVLVEELALEGLAQWSTGEVCLAPVPSSTLHVHACYPRGALTVYWACRMFSRPGE
jgi:hypothetical protein